MSEKLPKLPEGASIIEDIPKLPPNSPELRRLAESVMDLGASEDAVDALGGEGTAESIKAGRAAQRDSLKAASAASR